MNRRDFTKTGSLLGLGLAAGATAHASPTAAFGAMEGEFYKEAAKKLPIRHFDVVVAGAGTAGVIAAIAAARQGAKTILVEAKGYPGGVAVEGGTALHSFYNLWKTSIYNKLIKSLIFKNFHPFCFMYKIICFKLKIFFKQIISIRFIFVIKERKYFLRSFFSFRD